MKITDFQKRVDLYGADLSRWPVADVKDALHLIETTPEAARIFSAAEKLDQVLRQYQPMSVNTARLSAKLMEQIKTPQPRTAPASVSSPGWFYLPGGGLLAAIILGFLIGFQTIVTDNFLIDPAFYAQDQMINGGSTDMYEEGVY